jgi:molybdenum cofactor biosynthesis protein B
MGAVEPVSVQFAFLSVGSPDLETAKGRATSAGHRVVAECTVADTEAAIAAQLATWIADPEIDVVLVLAGNDSDAASKALRPLVSELLPGFTDLFRWLMFQEAGASAMLSSAEAAQCGSTIVFVLPGAIAAAMDKLILPQFDPTTTPRNLVAKLPRLRTEPSVADAVPETVAPEKTQGGSGMPARLPAIPPRKQSRTGANVMLRVATEVDPPTKPIDLGRLEQELANSGESGNDDPTSVGMTMPALPPGADEDDTHTDTLAAPPSPAERTTKLPSIVKPTGARGPNGPRAVVADGHRTPAGPVPAVSANRKFPDEAKTTVRPTPSGEPPTTAHPKFVEPATTVRPTPGTEPPTTARPKPGTEPPTTARPKPASEAPTTARPKRDDEAPTVARPKPADEAPTVMLLKPPTEAATVVRPAPSAQPKFVDAKRVQTQPGTGVTPEAEVEPQELEPEPEPVESRQLVVEAEQPRLREPTPPPPTPRTRPPTAPPPAAVKRPPTAPPPAAAKRAPTTPPPVKPPDDLPRGRFSYPVKKRRGSLVLMVLGLIAVGVLGFFAVVFMFRDKDEAKPQPAPTPPIATPTPPPPTPTPPIAEATPTPTATPVEPEIEMDPTPTPASGSNAARPTPPKPPKPATPPKPANPGSAAPVAAPPPDAAIAPVDDDCDETSCILSKYDRPCCVRYKPVTSDFKPHVGGTPDSLDKTMVKAGIEPIKPRVIGCGEKAGVKGTVKIAVTVSPEGAITTASVADSPDAALGQCVLAAMRNAKFGKSVNGASFTYPFAF